MHDKAYGRDQGREDDVRCPHVRLIRQPGKQQDHEEAQHIRWCRQAVRLDLCERAHRGDDSGHEEREGGEANVATEVHDGRDIRLGIFQRGENMADLEFRGAVGIGLLIAGDGGGGDLLLVVGEEVGFAERVGEDEPGYDGDADCGEAFDYEENLPGCDLRGADLRDTVLGEEVSVAFVVLTLM